MATYLAAYDKHRGTSAARYVAAHTGAGRSCEGAKNGCLGHGLGDNPPTVPEESPTPDVVELAQRWIDAVNAGDIDAATSLFAPDIVWEGVFATFEGRAAARGFVQDWVDAHNEFELVAEEVRDLGGGVAFSVFIQRGKP